MSTNSIRDQALDAMLQRGHEDLNNLRRADPALFLDGVRKLGELRTAAEKPKPTANELMDAAFEASMSDIMKPNGPSFTAATMFPSQPPITNKRPAMVLDDGEPDTSSDARVKTAKIAATSAKTLSTKPSPAAKPTATTPKKSAPKVKTPPAKSGARVRKTYREIDSDDESQDDRRRRRPGRW